MQQFSATAQVSHPAPLVFETIRDHTPQLIYLMPNVEQVEVLERREQPPVVHLHCRWHGSKSDLPWIVRPFVSKESLVWQDWADWDADQLLCTWQNRARALGRECVLSTGTTRIERDGDATARFAIDGELTVDPENIPGLPTSLARKFQRAFEGLIVRALTPNLTSIARAVQRYLDVRG